MKDLVRFSIQGGVTMPPTQRATKATGETLIHFDIVGYYEKSEEGLQINEGHEIDLLQI